MTGTRATDRADSSCDALVVCALKIEYDQLTRVTDGLLDGQWTETRTEGGRIVAAARFDAGAGGSIVLRAGFVGRMGREHAQALAPVLLAVHPARCIAMSGICAGRRGEVGLGDVVLADRLWSYDAGKRTIVNGREEFLADPHQWGVPGAWVERMRRVAIAPGSAWLSERPPSDDPKRARFRVHVGPIATGAAVSKTNEFARLVPSMRKVIGIDMEASGLAATADAHGVPVLVAKGVADFGDEFKDDRYQAFASRASAECLVRLLRDSADLLRPDAAPLQVGTPGSSLDASDAVEIVRALAECYPELGAVRALWERAGGLRSDVDNIERPRDLWQQLWRRSVQGGPVRPDVLLRTALEDFPHHLVFQAHLGR